MPLKLWIRKEYLQPKTIEKYRKLFKTAKPYAHLQLKKFFLEEKATTILKALSEEDFYPKESDLFKLKQTYDFASTKHPILSELRTFFLSREFLAYMNQLTGLTFKKDAIDMNGSMYEDTDFLLCHDDRLLGRKIAFLIYLTPLKKGEGGTLNLMASKKNVPTKVVKKIVPEFNCFTFFEVSPISYHEVEEVTAKKQRITVNGWFHG